MAEVFGVRSLLYWWGVLTATVFIRDWLKQLADFFKSSNTFTPDKIPFNILPGLNHLIDGAGDFVRVSIKFDANAPLLTIGSLSIPSYILAFLGGFLLILIGGAMVWRAIQSPIWFDDFAALLVMYIVLRIVGHLISSATSLPFAAWFRFLVDNQLAAYLVIMLLLLIMTFSGEGFQSKRAFWRAIIASALLSLFMYPREVSVLFGNFLDGLVQFGTGLASPGNVPFAVAWGLSGMLLALRRLASSDGGGHNGPRSGGEMGRPKVEVEAGPS
jgi:hypothetical protein